jgi:hypothetical protein
MIKVIIIVGCRYMNYEQFATQFKLVLPTGYGTIRLVLNINIC